MSELLRGSEKVSQVLSHEVTKFLFAAGIIFSLVRLVILPIQEIQLKLAQVQLDIEEIKEDRIEERKITDANKEAIIVIKEILKRYNIK